MNDRGDSKNIMPHDIVNQFDLLDSKWESKLEEKFVAQVENWKSYTDNEKMIYKMVNDWQVKNMNQ